MCAGGARGNSQSHADLFVRSARGHETDDLHFASGEARDSLRDRARRRTRAELAQLLARGVELSLCSQVCKHLVRAPQLAHRAFAIARLSENSAELPAKSRGMRYVRNGFERVDGTLKERNGFLFIAVQHLDERVARVSPGEPEA